MNKSARNVCFTLNNYTEEEMKDIQSWDCDYLIFGREEGESGTPHLQGYVEWKSSKRFSTMKKLNSRIHWEARRGTPDEASAYCKKDGDFFEKGEISKQGKRKDLDQLRDDILNGRSVDNITIEEPTYYHQYGRTLSRIEDIRLRQQFRTWEPECFWYYGESGSGKTSIWRTTYNPNTDYLWQNDNGWFDGYTGQETMIIDEFRGQIPYAELLSICGGAPWGLRRRNREPAPCLVKKVIITSVLRPEQVYHNLAREDSLDQLYRRFIVAEVVKGVILNPLPHIDTNDDH